MPVELKLRKHDVIELFSSISTLKSRKDSFLHVIWSKNNSECVRESESE